MNIHKKTADQGNNNSNNITRKDLINEFSKQKLLDKSLQAQISLKELLNEKLIGFFFDASWCLPGRSFCNEILIPFYNQAKKENLNFEIVYVSLVFDEKCLKEVFTKDHADWYLFPNEKLITNKLVDFLMVKYLPSLIILTSNFEIITSSGRKELQENGIDAIINWKYFWKQSKLK